MARKIRDVRILVGERPVAEVDAPVLVISQFTLYGDARKGRRPTWSAAAPGPVSEPVYDSLCAELAALGTHVERGTFGAQMTVELVNDGPFTLVLDSA
jgi:D-tyrosyl-tRNA(Tyr) deacylase